jgi:hypothetical protein
MKSPSATREPREPHEPHEPREPREPRTVTNTQLVGGGVADGTGNRTDWPISGGSVSLDLHHAWTYVFVNVGLGTNVSNFNITLTPTFVNVTGNGTYCMPVLPLPSTAAVTDGQNATIQVVTSGASGSALYNVGVLGAFFFVHRRIVWLYEYEYVPNADVNGRVFQCADIVFRSSAQPLSGDSCMNSTGVSAVYISQVENSHSSSNSTTAGKNSAPSGGASGAALTGAVALAIVFAAGLSL